MHHKNDNDNNKAMDAFYREIAQACLKHNVAGFIGMWFHQKTDEYGFIKNYDVADTDMKIVCEHIFQLLEGWADGIYTGEQTSYLKETQTLGNTDQN